MDQNLASLNEQFKIHIHVNPLQPFWYKIENNHEKYKTKHFFLNGTFIKFCCDGWK